MKNEITIHCVYHILDKKLYTYSLDEMILTILFIELEPTSQ